MLKAAADAADLDATETVALAEAHGRHLAENLDASGPWPSTDRSAMDGFGVVFDGASCGVGERFELVGEALAGKPFAGSRDDLRHGRAIRIMTGAVVPAGVTAVVPVENTAEGYGSTSEVELTEPAEAGAHIRRLGSEITSGARLLSRGVRLRAAEVGALAVEGRARVCVAKRPVVAILSTGDEVVPVDGASPEPHQVRDSNGPALAALVREAGCEPLPLGIARDEPADLRQRLERGLADADVLLTIGGVSKGTHDLVDAALTELGVARVFHGIVLKPGKPTWFGRAARGFVFGLPGNPASCCTVFDLLVRPLLDRLNGEPTAGLRLRARLAGVPPRKNWRLQALPASLRPTPDGVLEAVVAAARPSGDPFTLIPADGFALIPPGDEPPAVGDLIEVVPCSAAGWPWQGVAS